MRYEPFDRTFFEKNRERLRSQLLPSSLAIINANDIQPTTTDGNMPYYPNSDLFYFTGVEQEESILVIAPERTTKRCAKCCSCVRRTIC